MNSMYEVGTSPVLWESSRTDVQPPSVILLAAGGKFYTGINGAHHLVQR